MRFEDGTARRQESSRDDTGASGGSGSAYLDQRVNLNRHFFVDFITSIQSTEKCDVNSRLLRLEIRASQPRLNRLHFGTDVLLPVGHARRGQEGRREGEEEGGNIENRCLEICRKFAKCSC